MNNAGAASYLKRLEKWQRKIVLHGPVTRGERLALILLQPLGALFGLIARLRVTTYRAGLLRVYRAGVPVVSVGNLAAGGTGKTPVVDFLLHHFLAQGRIVAVVSRGYGGSLRDPVGVVSRGAGPLLPAKVCGDEPYLLARRNPQALIFVARKRMLGVREAEKAGAEIILLDDAFQHLAVARDLDLVLLDAQAPFGNGRPLPAGLLREFRSALQRADILLLTRCDRPGSQTAAFPAAWTSVHQLADYAIDLEGERVALADLRGKQLAAFAGIADPADFFNALEARGLELAKRIPLDDHVVYSENLLHNLTQQVEGADYLLTTEKDAVKLGRQNFKVPCLQVPVRIGMEKDAEFKKQLEFLLSSDEGENQQMKKELLEILACPQCKAKVSLNQESGGLRCESCRLEYPVRDAIPVMLIDEAEPF